MATFIGAILDLSGSMRSGSGTSSDIDREDIPWVRSVFTVIDDLVKYDVAEANQVFAIGIGAQRFDEPFDLIKTINVSQKLDNTDPGPASHNTIEEIFQTLEINGARTIRKWAEKRLVRQEITECEASLLLQKLRSDENFTNMFVNVFLPSSCRNWSDGMVGSLFESVWASAVTSFVQASQTDIADVVRKAMTYLLAINVESVIGVHDAANIIHGSVDNEDLSNERARQLQENVEPFIFGNTPLYTALGKATSIFSLKNGCDEHKKILFIVSDGTPSDNRRKYMLGNINSKIEKEQITVVGCYISSGSRVRPRRLYNTPGLGWEEGAQFLFDLSSFVPTSLVTRALFIKHDWEIDIDNNETRLFVHASHPDHIRDAVKLARNAVCSQEALSELLVDVSLDMYINQQNQNIPVQDQGEHGTCYANAVATVLHLAMRRIYGRDGGYPDFDKLKDELIKQYEIETARTIEALKDVCPKYRLKCKVVKSMGALKAITEKRLVVARFQLTEDEWKTFNGFFENCKEDVLTTSDLDLSKRREHARYRGHAVVLTGFNSKCLFLLNSLGENFGSNGIFRVENAEVLGLEFIDVYWNEDDLSREEKLAYRQHGSSVADTLMKSLKGLQAGKFMCPSCEKTSSVHEFTGTLSHATCPVCGNSFSSEGGNGNILALNVYLNSISKKS